MNNNLNHLLIEIANRAKCEEMFEARVDGIDVIAYRFDLMAVYGDFEQVNVPMAMANESVARFALYQMLSAR